MKTCSSHMPLPRARLAAAIPLLELADSPSSLHQLRGCRCRFCFSCSLLPAHVHLVCAVAADFSLVQRNGCCLRLSQGRRGARSRPGS